MASYRLSILLLALSVFYGIEPVHAQGGAVLNWLFRAGARGAASDAESLAAGAAGRAAARAGEESAVSAFERGGAEATTREVDRLMHSAEVSRNVDELRIAAFTEMNVVAATPLYEMFASATTPIGRRVNVVYSLFEEAKPTIAAELRKGVSTEAEVASVFEKNAVAAAEASVKAPAARFELSSGKIKFDKSFDKFGVRFEVGDVDLKSVAAYGAAAYFGCYAAIAAAEQTKQATAGNGVSILPGPLAKCLDTAFDIIKKRIAKELIDEMSKDQAVQATMDAD